MARLPQLGGDDGTWGGILNDYLQQVHKPDGTLKDGVVKGATIDDGSIEEVKLSSSVQTKLQSIGEATSWSAIVDKPAVIAAGADQAAARATIAAGTASTAADVGLANVDNTSDAAKNSASVTLTNKTISGNDNTLSDIPQSAVISLESNLSAKAPLIDTPRYLLFNVSWPTRPSNNRTTFFIGGSVATNEPVSMNLQAGDVWIPAN